MGIRRCLVREAAFILGPLLFLVNWSIGSKVLLGIVLTAAGALFMAFSLNSIFLGPGIVQGVVDAVGIALGLFCPIGAVGMFVGLEKSDD